MKLLVSDYDGTIYDQDSIRETRKNIDTIKKFKDNGNLFSIATARIFPSIKAQTEKFNIPYDYLICCDGGCIFDKNDKLIYSNPIDENQLLIIIKYLESLDYLKEYRLLNSYGKNTIKTNDLLCNIYKNGAKICVCLTWFSKICKKKLDKPLYI